MIVDDVPLHYAGSKMLRSNLNYMSKEIKFTVNQQVNIFIALDSKKPNILPNDFKVKNKNQY